MVLTYSTDKVYDQTLGHPLDILVAQLQALGENLGRTNSGAYPETIILESFIQSVICSQDVILNTDEQQTLLGSIVETFDTQQEKTKNYFSFPKTRYQIFYETFNQYLETTKVPSRRLFKNKSNDLAIRKLIEIRAQNEFLHPLHFILHDDAHRKVSKPADNQMALQAWLTLVIGILETNIDIEQRIAMVVCLNNACNKLSPPLFEDKEQDLIVTVTETLSPLLSKSTSASPVIATIDTSASLNRSSVETVTETLSSLLPGAVSPPPVVAETITMDTSVALPGQFSNPGADADNAPKMKKKKKPVLQDLADEAQVVDRSAAGPSVDLKLPVSTLLEPESPKGEGHLEAPLPLPNSDALPPGPPQSRPPAEEPAFRLDNESGEAQASGLPAGAEMSSFALIDDNSVQRRDNPVDPQDHKRSTYDARFGRLLVAAAEASRAQPSHWKQTPAADDALTSSDLNKKKLVQALKAAPNIYRFLLKFEHQEQVAHILAKMTNPTMESSLYNALVTATTLQANRLLFMFEGNNGKIVAQCGDILSTLSSLETLQCGQFQEQDYEPARHAIELVGRAIRDYKVARKTDAKIIVGKPLTGKKLISFDRNMILDTLFKSLVHAAYSDETGSGSCIEKIKQAFDTALLAIKTDHEAKNRLVPAFASEQSKLYTFINERYTTFKDKHSPKEKSPKRLSTSSNGEKD